MAMAHDIALVPQEAYLLLVATSPDAVQWLAANMPDNPRIGRAVVIQPQAVAPIVRGLMDHTEFRLQGL